MPQAKRDDYKHWTAIPVRWGDVDRLGHVNNVQYFRYSEEARTQWMDGLTRNMPDIWSGGQGPILAEIQCQFIRQLHHPATVQVGTRALRIGNSSIEVNQAFFLEAEEGPIAISASRIVWFDYQAQRSAAVPEAVRQGIRNAQPLPPEE